MADSCRECQRPVRWVELPSGKRMPVDQREEPAPKKGLVAVNPKRGTGKVLGGGDVESAWLWQDAGASFHRNHFLSCPARPKACRTRQEPAEGQSKLKGRELDADREVQRVLDKFPELA